MLGISSMYTGHHLRWCHDFCFNSPPFWVFMYFAIQLLSRVLLFATPRTAACQASLSFTISQSFLKLLPIESVMLSNQLILCRPRASIYNEHF